MKIFPAIDLFGGQAVRLYQGDYNQMTVYDPDPLNTVASNFEAAGAAHLHLVDLEGAKTGQTTNLPTIQRHRSPDGPVRGGGRRHPRTWRRCAAIWTLGVEPGHSRHRRRHRPGLHRPSRRANTGPRSPWGSTPKDGKVAIKRLAGDQRGHLAGLLRPDAGPGRADHHLHRHLPRRRPCAAPTWSSTSSSGRAVSAMDIIASGGVSSLEDITSPASHRGMYGAIIGKALLHRRHRPARQAVALERRRANDYKTHHPLPGRARTAGWSRASTSRGCTTSAPPGRTGRILHRKRRRRAGVLRHHRLRRGPRPVHRHPAPRWPARSSSPSPWAAASTPWTISTGC